MPLNETEAAQARDALRPYMDPSQFDTLADDALLPTLLTGFQAAGKQVKEAIQLSRQPQEREIDPVSISLIDRAFKSEEEQAVRSGVISEAGITALRTCFYAGGKPSKIALSMAAESANPLYSAVLETIRKFPGHAVNAVPKTVNTMATASGGPIKLNRDGTPMEADVANEAEELRKAFGIAK